MSGAAEIDSQHRNDFEGWLGTRRVGAREARAGHDSPVRLIDRPRRAGAFRSEQCGDD